jgi:hypothetical protein
MWVTEVLARNVIVFARKKLFDIGEYGGTEVLNNNGIIVLYQYTS